VVCAFSARPRVFLGMLFSGAAIAVVIVLLLILF
jgi:hypothetical protein